MIFHGFPRISGVRGQTACCRLCHRDAAPKENVTRSQLAAISSIHRFIGGLGWLAGWRAGLGCWLLAITNETVDNIANILANNIINEIANNIANILAPTCGAGKSQTWFENYTRKDAP